MLNLLKTFRYSVFGMESHVIAHGATLADNFPWLKLYLLSAMLSLLVWRYGIWASLRSFLCTVSNQVFTCLLDNWLILRWSLSLAAAKEIDGYLIFLGASGLLLTFLMWAAFFFLLGVWTSTNRWRPCLVFSLNSMARMYFWIEFGLNCCGLGCFASWTLVCKVILTLQSSCELNNVDSWCSSYHSLQWFTVL